MTFQLEIEPTLKQLLLQEDTDGDKKITVEDKGPKAFGITATDGEIYTIKGTYHLSNLLQELVIAKNEGKKTAEIRLSKIEELPVQRISRMIKDYYWNGLTRKIDAEGIEKLISDSKNENLTASLLRIYVPYNDTIALNYYKTLLFIRGFDA